MKAGYLFISGAVGFLLAMTIFRKGNEGFSCVEGNVQIQYCIDSNALDFRETADLDTRLNEYYQGALAAGDTTGFTLEKSTILNAAAYLHMDQDSRGMRFYPGMAGSVKYLIVKPLDMEGHERSNIGGAFELGRETMDGPCPKWCGNDSRIIIDPE